VGAFQSWVMGRNPIKQAEWPAGRERARMQARYWLGNLRDDGRLQGAIYLRTSTSRGAAVSYGRVPRCSETF
jgi:hypothetical protein